LATQTYTAACIFTGHQFLNDHAVVIEHKKVVDVVPALAAGNTAINFPNAFIAPAFIDLQIYGAGNKLFAVYPEKDALVKLVDYCRSGGAAFCMPTVATNHYDVFFKSIDAVRHYWNDGGTGILGLHIEGPWINKAKRGAHAEACIHSPTLEQAKELLQYGKGVIKLITLAPEVCSNEVINLIHSYGIVVSAGHSNASYAEATAAFDNGIKTATHLYNAMSALQHRSPGMVGAILNHDTVMCSIIPDGHHVDFAAVRLAKQIMQQRLFVITDAVTETTEGFYPHQFAGDKYESNSILSGSAITMAKAVKNLVRYCGIELEEALRMCSLYPAKLMGMQNEYGVIKPGAAASFVVMNKNFDVVEMIG
jgi:N-acetylglucosamine-6-phosphate deacetylase